MFYLEIYYIYNNFTLHHSILAFVGNFDSANITQYTSPSPKQVKNIDNTIIDPCLLLNAKIVGPHTKSIHIALIMSNIRTLL